MGDEPMGVALERLYGSLLIALGLLLWGFALALAWFAGHSMVPPPWPSLVQTWGEPIQWVFGLAGIGLFIGGVRAFWETVNIARVPKSRMESLRGMKTPLYKLMDGLSSGGQWLVMLIILALVVSMFWGLGDWLLDSIR
jgi:hypothetical protein